MAIAAALVGALSLVRWRRTAAAGPSFGAGEGTRPRRTAGTLARTASLLLASVPVILTTTAGLIAGAGNRAALFSRPGPSTLALILYCLIGLCVLAAIAGASIVITIWPVNKLGATDALPYMTALTLITTLIALTAGNFITYQPLVTAGTWIATTAGLL
ncbi:hypothetical protein OG429_40250 (plasmid) [Streptomyces sp. NBC_00190]|uniref:hypothetical protein n=1 Tax=unclassified Streptomyces TaxID=2593676 RepID=UPI002E2BA206|nr:hypothetical protein [Streptomyces sp. NBC_00190]WSZ45802.1 hypothetical protein OG239_44365 [Streptomyces sp. NBC_00868]